MLTTLRCRANASVAAILGLSLLTSFAAGSTGADDSPVSTEQLEACWADLEKGEMPATRALLRFASHPKETVGFLKTKLKPLRISSGQIKSLLLKLGSENDAVWKPAFEELDYFDPRLAIDLPSLMERYTEYPLRRRLVEVLSGYPPDTLKERKDFQLRPVGAGFNFSATFGGRTGSWWAEHLVERFDANERRGNLKKKWTRAVRAIVLLEHIHTPEAVAILRHMASGHPEAYPTKVAQEALATLGEKPVSTSPTPEADGAKAPNNSSEPAITKPRQN